MAFHSSAPPGAHHMPGQVGAAISTVKDKGFKPFRLRAWPSPRANLEGRFLSYILFHDIPFQQDLNNLIFMVECQ